MYRHLGKSLLIYNPASQNGNGDKIAQVAIRTLRELHSFYPVIERTSQSGHGEEIASEAEAFDTVIALGGDGLVHEVVNGLMEIREELRPRFGLIPVGSGNDFANTLGISKDIHKALGQLFSGHDATVDIGRCNGEYFAESVSFGLDAAIAIETMERRKRTGGKGATLYLASGMDQLRNHFHKYSYRLSVPEGIEIPPALRSPEEPKGTADIADAASSKANAIEGEMFLLAVQNGPTYGGGFNICPDASPTDGILNLCIATSPLNQMKAILIFLLAKGGHHTRFKQMEFLKTPSLHIEFDQKVPAQIDGEILEGESFDIEVLPRQLGVIAVKDV